MYTDCHELMQEVKNFHDVAMVTVKRSYYKIHFWYMSKSDAIELLDNAGLSKKMEHDRVLIFFITNEKWIKKM